MQSSLPSLILLRVFQTHPCDDPPENYVIRKARIIHNCVMVFSTSLVPRMKENKTNVWFNLYGVWILDKISFNFRQKPHCSVKYKKVLNKTEASRKSNIPRSITFSDKSVPFCHTFHIHKDQTKNNDFPMFSTPNINILIRYVVILLLHERVCIIPLCVTNGSINSLTVV